MKKRVLLKWKSETFLLLSIRIAFSDKKQIDFQYYVSLKPQFHLALPQSFIFSVLWKKWKARERIYFQIRWQCKVSVQGIVSLNSHFAALCRGFGFYKVKKKTIIIFKKERGKTFTLLIIFIVKSLQKEQNSTNLLL